MSAGLRTFCQRWRHCTSVLSYRKDAIFFQFFAPYYPTSLCNFSSSWGVHQCFCVKVEGSEFGDFLRDRSWFCSRDGFGEEGGLWSCCYGLSTRVKAVELGRLVRAGVTALEGVLFSGCMRLITTITANYYLSYKRQYHVKNHPKTISFSFFRFSRTSSFFPDSFWFYFSLLKHYFFYL